MEAAINWPKMKETDKLVDSKQAFAWKAVWFSFYAPPASALAVYASFSFLNHSCSNETYASAGRLILAGALIVQIVSLIMGFVGNLIAESALAKGIAFIGLLFSVGIGFVTLIVLCLLSGAPFWSGC